MLRITLLFILTTVYFTSTGQYIAELEKRNGFKDIKLGMPVDSVMGIKLKKEFKEKDEFEAKLYTVDNLEYAKIGEVDVNRIELKTYKNLIYQITVITEKDTRLMKALESIYGASDYDRKKEAYFWKSKTLILKFKSHSKNELQLDYISYVIHSQMKADKGKKVDDIAEDF